MFLSQMHLIELVLVLAISFILGKAIENAVLEECDAESVVNLSMLFGSHNTFSKKDITILEIQTDIDEVEAELNRLETVMNETVEQKEALELEINDLATPELNELAASQICESEMATDCCQVNTLYNEFQRAYLFLID